MDKEKATKKYNLPDVPGIEWNDMLECSIQIYDEREHRDLPWQEESLSAFLQKVDRLLSGNLLVVNSIKIPRKPWEYSYEEWLRRQPTAFSTERSVHINYRKMWQMSDERPDIFIPLIKALNYHEYAHIRYTIVRKDKDAAPYAERHDLPVWKFCEILNWLEDLRIETIFTKVYPKSIPYFTLLIAVHIQKEKWSWVMTYGRKYLPRELRRLHHEVIVTESKDEILIEAKEKKIMRLIDEYLVATDKQTMLEIARYIMYLLPHEFLPQIVYKNMTSSDSLSGRGRVKNEAQGEVSDAVKKIKVQISDEEKDKETEVNIEKARKEQGDNSDDEGDGGDVSDEADGGDVSDEADGGDVAGSGTTDTLEEVEHTDEETFYEHLHDAFEKAKSDITPHVKNDIQQIENRRDYTLDNDLRKHGRQIAVILRDVKNALRACYQRKQRSGRVDLRAAMAAEKTGETRVFQKYQRSEIEKMKMGVNIHVDGSGSMCAREENIKLALDAAEALSYGLEEMGCKVKVYVFDTQGYLSKDWSDRNVYRYQPDGGTDPFSVLIQSLKDFKKLKEEGYQTFMNIVISDGIWDNAENNHKIIKAMNAQGVYTVEIGVGHEATEEHGSMFYQVISDFDDLLLYLKSIVRKVGRDIQHRYHPDTP